MTARTLHNLYEERAQLDEAIRNAHALIKAFKNSRYHNDVLEHIATQYETIYKLRSMKQKNAQQIKIYKGEKEMALSNKFIQLITKQTALEAALASINYYCDRYPEDILGHIMQNTMQRDLEITKHDLETITLKDLTFSSPQPMAGFDSVRPHQENW